MAYFLESPSRLAKDAYFSRLLDIIRRPEGAALLNALSGAPAQLAAVLAATTEPGEPESRHVLQLLGAGHGCGHVPIAVHAHCSSGPDAESIAAAQLNCIHLIHTMSKLLPAWLPEPLFLSALDRWRSVEFQSRCKSGLASRADTMHCLLHTIEVWRSSPSHFPACHRLASATFQPLPQRLESKWLARIMLSYIQRQHSAFHALFDLMAVFSGPMGKQLAVPRNWPPSICIPTESSNRMIAAVDFTFLKTFVSDVVAEGFTADEKQQVWAHGGMTWHDMLVNVKSLARRVALRWPFEYLINYARSC